jgi:D-lyxose ketol-isomerase
MTTYHEKIMIAKVRHNQLNNLQAHFEELIDLAKQKQGSMAMVAKMKELVPEFVSNNSVFESLDKKESTANVVSITKVG